MLFKNKFYIILSILTLSGCACNQNIHKIQDIHSYSQKSNSYVSYTVNQQFLPDEVKSLGFNGKNYIFSISDSQGEKLKKSFKLIPDADMSSNNNTAYDGVVLKNNTIFFSRISLNNFGLLSIKDDSYVINSKYTVAIKINNNLRYTVHLIMSK